MLRTSSDNKVLIVGAGAAGLAVAVELADFGIEVALVEKTGFAGGHAVQLACKATDTCVRCGVCRLEDLLARASTAANISLYTHGEVTRVNKGTFFEVRFRQHRLIDAGKCDLCGLCIDTCPVAGALVRGTSAHHPPVVALDKSHCRHFQGGECRLCEQACPSGAIDLDAPAEVQDLSCAAMVVATGFSPIDPAAKPYGYGRFANVITSYQAERMLRRQGCITRPSDGAIPRRVAFIQCAGSRDRQLGHPWCSKICCATSLRLGGRIKDQRPDSHITVFYIDIQTSGKNFASFLDPARTGLHLRRLIPADIFETENNNLQVSCFNSRDHAQDQETFELVVLAVGMAPRAETSQSAQLFGLRQSGEGFLVIDDEATASPGLFVCGSATGPATIAETLAAAGATSLNLYQYLLNRKDP